MSGKWEATIDTSYYSVLCGRQIRSLHRLRSAEMLSAIGDLARSQIHAAQILQAELSKHLERVRQFPVPEPGQLGRRP